MVYREITKGAEGEVDFFFQAEDGIRDIGVTGVQTCALPICANSCVHGQFMPQSLYRNFCILIDLLALRFLHGITHFCTELQSNSTALDQSESRNFFIYMFNNTIYSST